MRGINRKPARPNFAAPSSCWAGVSCGRCAYHWAPLAPVEVPIRPQRENTLGDPGLAIVSVAIRIDVNQHTRSIAADRHREQAAIEWKR